MPLYAFEDPKTGEQWETNMTYEEMLAFKEANPGLHQIYKMNFSSSGAGDGIKNDDGWKELMGRIADQNPYSNLADDYGRKDPKSVKLRDSVKRVKKKLGQDVSTKTIND